MEFDKVFVEFDRLDSEGNILTSKQIDWAKTQMQMKRPIKKTLPTSKQLAEN